MQSSGNIVYINGAITDEKNFQRSCHARIYFHIPQINSLFGYSDQHKGTAAGSYFNTALCVNSAKLGQLIALTENKLTSVEQHGA